MADCTGYSSISRFLPNGLYRIKLPVVGHVTTFCVIDIHGGGWTVSVLLIRPKFGLNLPSGSGG